MNKLWNFFFLCLKLNLIALQLALLYPMDNFFCLPYKNHCDLDSKMNQLLFFLVSLYKQYNEIYQNNLEPLKEANEDQIYICVVRLLDRIVLGSKKATTLFPSVTYGRDRCRSSGF